MTGAGFPHSGISGSSLACQLTGAYRRLLRPSSSPGTKASALCPYLFIHQVARTGANTHAATTTHPYLRCKRSRNRCRRKQARREWRRAGSNRRPSGCKPDALPAELRPRRLAHRSQELAADGAEWAWADLNSRPRAYQARALTN